METKGLCVISLTSPTDTTGDERPVLINLKVQRRIIFYFSGGNMTNVPLTCTTFVRRGKIHKPQMCLQ